METWDVLKILAGGLVMGLLLGFFIGERVVLRHLYDLWPTIQPVILKAGYRDPARPWWKVSKTYWTLAAVFALVVMLVQVNDTPEASALAAEPSQVEVGPWQLHFPPE